MNNTFESFKKELYRQGKSGNTINSYITSIRDYIKYIEEKVGSFSIDDILELDIREYKSYLLNIKKHKPATINLKLAALSSFCDYLTNKEILKKNPVKEVGYIKTQQQNLSPKVLDKNILYRFRREFYSAENLRDILIYELLYNTGVRVSELCNIELDDIEISERKGNLIIRKGKGSKYRSIPLNSKARKAIVEYLEIRPITKEKKLLQGERGGLKRQAINKILNKYARRAGLEEEHIHPHKLRHQFGRGLVEQNVDLVTVAEYLGHSDINITRRYTLPSEEKKAEMIERL